MKRLLQLIASNGLEAQESLVAESAVGDGLLLDAYSRAGPVSRTIGFTPGGLAAADGGRQHGWRHGRRTSVLAL